MFQKKSDAFFRTAGILSKSSVNSDFDCSSALNASTLADAVGTFRRINGDGVALRKLFGVGVDLRGLGVIIES